MEFETLLTQLLAPEGGILRLEARAPARKIARRWSVQVSRDLFGWTRIEWGWGPIGCPGQVKTCAFASPEEAHSLIMRLLRRRRSAPRRIGATYRPVAQETTPAWAMGQ